MKSVMRTKYRFGNRRSRYQRQQQQQQQRQQEQQREQQAQQRMQDGQRQREDERATVSRSNDSGKIDCSYGHILL